jgi:homoserine kinase
MNAESRMLKVRVPGSTSNLGAGFDCVGLALGVHLEAEWEPGPGTLRVERAGTVSGAGAVADDLVAAALRDRLRAAGGGRGAGGELRVRSAIPIGRGLGSSAAAVVAGAALAELAAGRASAELGETVFTYAAAREGHPDNAAPAVLGGLVAVARGVGGAEPGYRPLRLGLAPTLAFAFAAPATTVSTAAARSALPAQVAHVVAARALGRLAALFRGLETGEPELLRAGFADELHVPHRLKLIPGGAEALDAAREAGALAATISGSGSGLIAVCGAGAQGVVAEAMRRVFERAGGGAVAFGADVDTRGLTVLEGAEP